MACSAPQRDHGPRAGAQQEDNMDILAAADHLLRGPFGAVKRFALREGEPDSQQHVKDMSFAQELVMMPPFPRESAALPAVVKGIHTKIISNYSLSGSDQTSDPLCDIPIPPGQASFPETVSASRPAVPPILPFRPDPQQLKESLPMQGHTGPLARNPLHVTAASSSLTPRGAPPPLKPFIDKEFQKYVHGKEKKPAQVGVGAHFEVVGKDFIIRSLVKDGPAHRTGQMKVGDRLLSVDGYEAQGKSMFELSKKLLGLEGSTVTLSMQRVTDNSTYSLTMVRKETFRKSGAGLGSMVQRNGSGMNATLRNSNSIVVL